MPRKNQPTYGEEHIANLIPQADPIKTKPAQYMSKHRPNVAKTTKASKCPQKTMGPAKLPVETPENYLKKKDRTGLGQGPAGIKKLNQEEKKRYHQTRKDPLPKEQAIIPPNTNKDFLKKNAIENITSIPIKPKYITCDTVKGNKNVMEESGLVPKYSGKDNYGKVPVYIKRKKEFEHMQREEYEKYMAEVVKAKSLEEVGGAEREETLKALKSKWSTIHEEFQGLSVVTDTLSKKHRKERLEGEMLAIETDIKVLERHDKIFLTKQILY